MNNNSVAQNLLTEEQMEQRPAGNASKRVRKNDYQFVANRLKNGAIRGCPEVAEIMGISVKRVQQLDKSAINKLRRSLKRWGN